MTCRLFLRSIRRLEPARELKENMVNILINIRALRECL